MLNYLAQKDGNTKKEHGRMTGVLEDYCFDDLVSFRALAYVHSSFWLAVRGAFMATFEGVARNSDVGARLCQSEKTFSRGCRKGPRVVAALLTWPFSGVQVCAVHRPSFISDSLRP